MTTINLAESQNLPFACLTPLYFVLYAVIALHLSRVLYKSTLFMQNKPNFKRPQMNVNKVLTKDYENQGRLRTPAKTNPIFKKSQIFKNQNPLFWYGKLCSMAHIRTSQPTEAFFHLTRNIYLMISLLLTIPTNFPSDITGTLLK